MGIHVCAYCRSLDEEKLRQMEFDPFGSGDAAVWFASGRAWQFPELMPHYVAEHKFRPPDEFVSDVMQGEVIGGGFCGKLREVGYLTGADFPRGEVPEGLASGVFALIERAKNTPGWYRQSK